MEIPSYLTKTFDEVWDSEENFLEDCQEFILDDEAPYHCNVTEKQLKKILWTLIAHHKGDHLAWIDVDKFKFAVFDIIEHYGEIYFAQLDIINNANATEIEDFVTGGGLVNNFAQNPNTVPQANSIEPLLYIKEQNYVTNIRGKDNALLAKRQFLRGTYTKEFYNRFEPLFKQGLFAIGNIFYYGGFE